MKIYRLDYRLASADPYDHSGMTTEWFTSERAAVVRRLELFSKGCLAGKKREHEIWGVEVPTRKTELVGWLNAEWGL